MAHILSVLSVAWIGWLGAGPDPEVYVEVPLQGPESIRYYLDKRFDIGGVNLETQSISLVLKQSELGRTRSLPVRSTRLARLPDSQFKNAEEVEQILRDVVDRFPHLTRMESIGKSIEGRDIWALEISSHFSIAPKPTLLVDAVHHAREVMTVEVALDLIDYLTARYNTDQQVRRWVNRNRIVVIPMLNPDGNDRVWTSDTMWRKNARGGYGVDINRNYPFAWNTCNGSSGNKADDDYRGPSAASEPETQAIARLVEQIKPKMNLSYHSYSEIVIYPFGCRPKKIPAPDAAQYWKVGGELAKRLVRDSGNGSYVAGTSYELLYNVDGGSVDWMYGQHQVMSFVVEVNSTNQGFQPSFSQWRDSTVARQRPGWMYVLDVLSGKLN